MSRRVEQPVFQTIFSSLSGIGNNYSNMQIDAAYRPNALKRTKDDGSESWVVGYFSSVHCWWRQHCLDNLVWLLVDDVKRNLPRINCYFSPALMQFHHNPHIWSSSQHNWCWVSLFPTLHGEWSHPNYSDSTDKNISNRCMKLSKLN